MNNNNMEEDATLADGPDRAVQEISLPRMGIGTSFYPQDLPLVGRPAKGTAAYAREAEIRTIAAVRSAIEHGCRLIDTANGYSNQRHVGTAIQQCIQAGFLQRSELVVVNKLSAKQLRTAADASSAVEAGLEQLGLAYVDVLLAQQPVDRDDVWCAMEEAVNRGQVRFLGVANHDRTAGRAALERLLRKARIPPRVVQMEMHPFQTNQDALAQCVQHGLQVMAYSPLGAPHKLEQAATRDRRVLVLEHPDVLATAKECCVTPAQVLLQWGMQRGCTVIPKSFAPAPHEHVLANLQTEEVFAAIGGLTAEQMSTLTRLNKGIRCLHVMNRAEQQGCCLM